MDWSKNDDKSLSLNLDELAKKLQLKFNETKQPDFSKSTNELLQKIFPSAYKDGMLIKNDEPALQPVKSNQQPDKDAIEAGKWLSIIKHPCVIVILGGRGSGKSSLGYRLLEHLRWTSSIYLIGLPSNAQKHLPNWIGTVPELQDLSHNCIAMVDESYILYHARSSMTARAKAMSEMINLSRQRGQTIIFVTQDSGQIDRNILSSTDIIIFKEPGLLQTRFDRSELHSITEEASRAFQSIMGDKKKWAYVLAQNHRFIGLMENSLPTFWSNSLSHAFASTGECKVKPARKMTVSERIAKAKEYEHQGFNRSQIARLLGVSKGSATNYLDNYPYKGDG